MTTANRNHKDSLFTHYFSDKARLIEAYNAIAGTHYPPTANIEIRKLRDVLFRSQHNDIAFMIDGRLLVLVEAQSSVNGVMPLRMLLYISEIYRRFVPKSALYGNSKGLVPTPEFIVLYNGLRKYPDKKILKLSDLFIEAGTPSGLELEVAVYNIAKGHNEDLLKRSDALSDYAAFISQVYERTGKGETREEAIENTIRYFLEHGMMEEYLKHYSSEVRRMLSLEWDDEVFAEVMKEEGKAEGLVEGRVEGRAEERLANAARMKAYGMEIALIEKITGLTREEISTL